jgi:hypothetical protein
MSSISRKPSSKLTRGLNLGELVYFLHQRARARGLDEREANEATAAAVGRALGLLGNRRLLGALGAG